MRNRGYARIFLIVLTALTAALMAASCASAAVSIELIGNKDLYPPGRAFDGTFRLVFDSQIPPGSRFAAQVDGAAKSVLDADPYLTDMTPQYKQYQFSYNLTASGKNEWHEYPDKTFRYRIRASGTCGNEGCFSSGNCDCTPLCTPPSQPPYHCSWSLTYTGGDLARVNANEGLKEIIDASLAIAPPVSANGDTVWSQTYETYLQYGVNTTMRAACGNMEYYGEWTEPNGWVKKTLESFEQIPGTTSKRTITGPFDQKSLTTDRALFTEGNCNQPYVCGGVYKDGKFLASGTGYAANGAAGEIIIYNFNPNSVYTITYLPPNGPFLCAHTDYEVLKSSAWKRTRTEAAAVRHDMPFLKTYAQAEIPDEFNASNRITALIKPPDCPPNTQACRQTASYSAAKASDPTAGCPGGCISVSFNKSARTVTATVSKEEFLSSQATRSIGLAEFSGLKTPAEIEEHTLSVSLRSPSGSEIAESSPLSFQVCEDRDGDGFCGQAGDCDESDPKAYPGAKELCNQKDDDCDGQADEDFNIAGRMLGAECGLGPCAGAWSCSPDGSGVACNASSGPKKEICDNRIDDDCDGVEDEQFEENPKGDKILACYCQDGQYTEYCVCQDGQHKTCGSNVGACREGYRPCLKGLWSECLDAIVPSEETCNSIDDDCNAVADDVYGGASVQETGCGCYDGGLAKKEECNNVDDDCNGQVDDGIPCCEPGEARPCGLKRGVCRQGTQSCGSNGLWEQECRGGVRPEADDICYNNLDDNCNGRTDEGCDTGFTCRNNYQDLNEEGVDCGGPCAKDCGIPYNWLLFAGGIIVLIVGIVVVEFRSRV